MITFQAIITSRSSRMLGGAPGEAEIQARNPDRGARILRATGWSKLEPGSLNLDVHKDAVHRLLLCEPVLRESAETFSYPPGDYAHIPSLRVGYLYFPGFLVKGIRVPVLFRRAMNPIPRLIEAFSAESLRATLALSDADVIVCELNENAV
jgi:hypothetical protein